jgi:hypothetical protein
MRSVLAFVFAAAICTAPQSAALAAWGCITTDNSGGHDRNWGYPTKEAASAAVVQQCSAGGYTGCRLDDCKENIDNQAQAVAAWPMTGPVTNCYGNAKC